MTTSMPRALNDERDSQVRPQDDLVGHVNNPWTATASIPPDRGSYGTFNELR